MTEPENTEPPIDQSAEPVDPSGDQAVTVDPSGDQPETVEPSGDPSAGPRAEGASGAPVDGPATGPVETAAPASGNSGSRRRWLRLAVLVGVALLLMFALSWKNCRQGLGLGGSPANENERNDKVATPMSVDATPMAAAAPCQVRVDAGGIQVKGKLISSPMAAVEACAPSGLVILIVTGDAVFGVVEQLELALRNAGIDVQRLK